MKQDNAEGVSTIRSFNLSVFRCGHKLEDENLQALVSITFLALAVPTALGLALATFFCPPDFFASFSALTFSSA